MKKRIPLLALTLMSTAMLAQSPRLCLYEEFTGETCPPCASANPPLNALLALPTNTPKVVAIKWQVPIPSAPSNSWSLYQTNKTEIDWRYRSTTAGGYGYGINSAPSGKMDGQNVTVFGAASNHPNSLNSGIISTAQTYTSAFTINMTRAWDVSGTSINLTVNIAATAPFTSVGNLVFRTVMVERVITFSVQPGTNGEKHFEDVGIKSFPTLQNGVAMASTWTIGQTQTFTLNCPIPSYTRDISEIAFVGFIQDDGDRKVAQAGRAGKEAVPYDAMAIDAKVDATCSNTIAPEITVKNNGGNAITNMTITPYIDGVAATPFTWSGNLAAGATSNIMLNTLTTPTASGAHTFSYNITALNAADFKMSNNSAKVSYVVASSYQGTPVAEGFVLGAFPPAGFTHVNPNGGPAWSRVTNAGGFMLTTNAARYDFFTNTVIGDQDEFILPPINLSGADVPYLEFDIAYAQKTAASNDKLEVFVSDDCGSSWTSVFLQSGSNMAIVNPQTAAYIPASSADWRTESAPLTNFNKPVLVKFVTTSDNGNHLYIDNINLKQTSPVGIQSQRRENGFVAVYPNPASNQATVRINVNEVQNARISVMNNLGQLVAEKSVSLNSGVNVIKLDIEGDNAGVYSVVVNTNAGSVVKKLNVGK